MKKPYDIYRKTNVTTASRETILLMMYEGAIRFLKQGMEALQKENYSEMSKVLTRTQEIISELRATLNFEVGGELAVNLEKLYLFITQKLIQGNLEKSLGPLGEALQVLENLHSTWQEAIENLKKEQVTAEK